MPELYFLGAMDRVNGVIVDLPEKTAIIENSDEEIPIENLKQAIKEKD